MTVCKAVVLEFSLWRVMPFRAGGFKGKGTDLSRSRWEVSLTGGHTEWVAPMSYAFRGIGCVAEWRV